MKERLSDGGSRLKKDEVLSFLSDIENNIHLYKAHFPKGLCKNQEEPFYKQDI
jgi:hypothetical protein